MPEAFYVKFNTQIAPEIESVEFSIGNLDREEGDDPIFMKEIELATFTKNFKKKRYINFKAKAYWGYMNKWINYT